MVHGENRIPYWIDRSLTGLAGPDYDATISFGLPFELGDCQYGKCRIQLSSAYPTHRRLYREAVGSLCLYSRDGRPLAFSHPAYA